MSEQTENNTVEAYAKLQGKNDCWYVLNLPFVFGRKSEKSPADFMDICPETGNKTISREFAVLTYSEEEKGYMLEVKGKQGCTVNKKYIAKGEKCRLNNKDAIRMGLVDFYFLLPQTSSTTSNTNERVSEKRAEPPVNEIVEMNAENSKH